MSVKVGYLNASNQALQRSMPGGYVGYLPDGNFSSFQSFDAVFIDVVDSYGKPLFIQQSESTLVKRKASMTRCESSPKCFDEFFYDDGEYHSNSTFVDYITLSIKVS
jgi:hypothetical protein